MQNAELAASRFAFRLLLAFHRLAAFDVDADDLRIAAAVAAAVVGGEAVLRAKLDMACAVSTVDDDRADGGAIRVADVGIDKAIALRELRSGLARVSGFGTAAHCAGLKQRVFDVLPAAPLRMRVRALIGDAGGADE